MTTTLTKDGHLALPPEWWRGRNIQAGDAFEVLVTDDDPDEIVLRRVPQAPSPDLVDHLLACPVKGFMPRLRRKAETPRKVRL